jgi:hypothetical protein
MAVKSGECQVLIPAAFPDQLFQELGIAGFHPGSAITGIYIYIERNPALRMFQKRELFGVIQEDGYACLFHKFVQGIHLGRIIWEGHQDILPACFCKIAGHLEG